MYSAGLGWVNTDGYVCVGVNVGVNVGVLRLGISAAQLPLAVLVVEYHGLVLQGCCRQCSLHRLQIPQPWRGFCHRRVVD